MVLLEMQGMETFEVSDGARIAQQSGLSLLICDDLSLLIHSDR